MKPLAKASTHKLKVWKNICVDFMKAYQQKKVDEMISLCHPESTVWFKPLGDQGKGKVHEFGKVLWSNLIECFPNLDNTVHSIISEDVMIKCVVSIRGTQDKDFAGIENKGGSFDADHIFVFEMEDQKIKHVDVTWDHEDFITQLS
ncbi:MAG: nuclear transport factor 2 family protein [Saprospiraceae bacterium]|nr:nuclear transport factor 2 family protein [Saprospiraceae bacterium]